MAIPRKPTKTKKSVENFIKNAPLKDTSSNETVLKDKIVVTSISLKQSDLDWIKNTLSEINQKTLMKIDRSKLIALMIDLMKGKKPDEILSIIRSR